MDDRTCALIRTVVCIALIMVAIGLCTSRSWRPVAVSTSSRKAAVKEDPEPGEPQAVATPDRRAEISPWAEEDPGRFELAQLAPPKRSIPPGALLASRTESDRRVEEPPRLSSPQLGAPVATPAILCATQPISASAPPRVAKNLAEDTPVPWSVWPYPTTLASRLMQLSEWPACRELVERTIAGMRRLSAVRSLAAPDAEPELKNLRSLAERMRQQAEEADSRTMQHAELARSAYALTRRLAVWEQVREIVCQREPLTTAALPTGPEVAAALADVDTLLGRSRWADGWRRFLDLEQVKRLAADDGTGEARRRVAQAVLRRMDSTGLSVEQRRLLREPPMRALTDELKRWAATPVDYAALLRELQHYEATAAAAAAKEVAGYCQQLRRSPHASDRELARRLEAHYRNANLRVAVSDKLINRLLPEPGEIEGPVTDEILGAQVVGRSKTGTQLKVVLLPDPQQWRIGLDVEGDVKSDTSATKGPVTYFNEGVSHFSARKLLVVDRRGLRTRWTQTAANADASLVGVRTKFDDIPLLSQLAHAVAVQQHELNRNEANWEAEAKLATRANIQFDQKVRQQLAAATGRLEENVLKPLQKLELNPRIVDMATTSDRLIARCCLASDEQLAAHTPRPLALSDSLLSVQIHETSVNNTVEQLQLDGRQADLRDLYLEIGKAFNRSDLEIPDDFPDNVTVQFAATEAARARFEDGRAVLTLKLAKLAEGRRRLWRDFEVRAYYRPEASGLDAKLVRDEDESLELIGARLGLGDRVALRGVFAKVFSRRRPLHIIGERFADEPRLDDLQVTQFTVDHGWIGVAVGPQSEAQQRWADGNASGAVVGGLK